MLLVAAYYSQQLGSVCIVLLPYFTTGFSLTYQVKDDLESYSLMDFTDICNEGKAGAKCPSLVLPVANSLISSSSPFWYRLETHPELHSYRPSSAGTGVGCLLFLLFTFWRSKPVLFFRSAIFRIPLASGPFNLGCVISAVELNAGAFYLKYSYLVSARLL